MLITAYPRAIAYVGTLWQPISWGRVEVLGLLKPGYFDNRFLSLPALRNDRSILIAFLEIELVPNEQRPVSFKNWWWGNQRLKPRALVKPRRGFTLYTFFSYGKTLKAALYGAPKSTKTQEIRHIKSFLSTLDGSNYPQKRSSSLIMRPDTHV